MPRVPDKKIGRARSTTALISVDFCLHHHVEHRRDDDADDGPGVGEGAAEPARRNRLAVVADVDASPASVQGDLERFLHTAYRSVELLLARSRGFVIMFKAVSHFWCSLSFCV